MNPRDTAASVRAAVRERGLAGVAPWHWLGVHKQLAAACNEYHLPVAPPVNRDIDHTEALCLVDRCGYERAGYLWPFASRFAAIYDVHALATRKAA